LQELFGYKLENGEIPAKGKSLNDADTICSVDLYARY